MSDPGTLSHCLWSWREMAGQQTLHYHSEMRDSTGRRVSDPACDRQNSTCHVSLCPRLMARTGSNQNKSGAEREQHKHKKHNLMFALKTQSKARKGRKAFARQRLLLTRHLTCLTPWPLPGLAGCQPRPHRGLTVQSCSPQNSSFLLYYLCSVLHIAAGIFIRHPIFAPVLDLPLSSLRHPQRVRPLTAPPQPDQVQDAPPSQCHVSDSIQRQVSITDGSITKYVDPHLKKPSGPTVSVDEICEEEILRPGIYVSEVGSCKLDSDKMYGCVENLAV